MVGTVLDAMTDHEKLAMQVLDDPSHGRDFALLILRLLTGGNAELQRPAEVATSCRATGQRRQNLAPGHRGSFRLSTSIADECSRQHSCSFAEIHLGRNRE
ncbi:MAG: hypothetical protein U5R48_06190 [Gammaproteobacteria bacterium]|nr:hypothetical protein [Gammaproteobacteria bacterium]